jgi:hypothetical protein
LDTYNSIKLQGRVDIADAIFFAKTEASKRNIDEIGSSDDDENFKAD